jgi:hypothetical protein
MYVNCRVMDSLNTSTVYCLATVKEMKLCGLIPNAGSDLYLYIPTIGIIRNLFPVT